MAALPAEKAVGRLLSILNSIVIPPQVVAAVGSSAVLEIPIRTQQKHRGRTFLCFVFCKIVVSVQCRIYSFLYFLFLLQAPVDQVPEWPH